MAAPLKGDRQRGKQYALGAGEALLRQGSLLQLAAGLTRACGKSAPAVCAAGFDGQANVETR